MQGRHLCITLHVLLDALLHLLEASREGGSQDGGGSDADGEEVVPASGHGGCGGSSRWWGSLGSTQEEGLQALARTFQTMWELGGCPREPGLEAELSLPARSRTSPGLPSRMDVPTRDEALARDCAAAVLGATVSGSWRHWCGPRTIPNQS